jgi:DNA-binding PadR family transcriptional regulator
MNGQLPKGHLDLLLLSVLTGRALHGYAVIEELRQRSGDAFDLPEGTVYPALHRLEKSRYLASEWSVVQGRRRRTYRLTDRGRGAMEEQERAWDEFSGAVSRVLQGAS